MVIIWRGLGWLVAVIVFGLSLIANLLFNLTYGGRYYDNHKWPFAISLFISGIVCFFLGRYLKARSDRIAIDKQTGQEIVVNQSQNTLFFVPMHLWGIVMMPIAVVIFVLDVFRH